MQHFSDASVEGYGQCSYLRLINEHGKVHGSFHELERHCESAEVCSGNEFRGGKRDGSRSRSRVFTEEWM